MSRGLTLIESIIGIMIISIGVVFIISIFPVGIMITDLNQRGNIALFLASSKIEELSSYPYSEVETGTFVEDFKEIDNYENYKRTTEIRFFDPENTENNGYVDNDIGMKKIEVNVSFKALTEKSVVLEILIVEK